MPMLNLSVVRPFEEPPAQTDLVVFSDINPYISECEAQPFLQAARRYAREFQVYLVPNRFVARDRLALCLISPEGEVLGGQRATHLSISNRELLQRSEDLTLFKTPFGTIFLAVDVDLCQPEVIRAAALSGAQLVIGSRLIESFDYTAIKGICATLGSARSNGIFVLDANSMAATLAAPAQSDFCPDGYLLRDCEEFPVSAVLDLSQAKGCVRQLSQAFYRRYQRELEEVPECSAAI